MLSADNDFKEILKQSFEFWHNNYIDSPLNYTLVWKKALESNFEIIKRLEKFWEKNTNKIREIQMQQFFEMWSYAIRKSNFEMAKKSMQDWEEFWEDTTDEEFRTYADILQMIEKYWKDIQTRNFE
jgi:hypothetical protein